MEQLLSDSALAGELNSIKTTADLLASQKLRYSHNYVPPIEERPRKATLVNVPVCEPPSTSSTGDADAGPSTDAIKLTIKSLKPPLTFTLSARPTSTISDLKAQLSSSESSAPPPEAQRWVLKGKVLGDSRLLKEFPVEEGSTINLMVTKAVSPAAAPPLGTPMDEDPSEETPSVPALTLSEPSSAAAPSSAAPPALKVDLDALPMSTSASTQNPAHAGLSDSFLSSVSSPDLWQEVRDVVEKRFETAAEAQKVWEAMFGGAREWISPNQKALVREKVGYSAMGGIP
ncbi:hypothetical protein JCM11251_001505 [Rhodosporidiobolus azoricus]